MKVLLPFSVPSSPMVMRRRLSPLQMIIQNDGIVDYTVVVGLNHIKFIDDVQKCWRKRLFVGK